MPGRRYGRRVLDELSPSAGSDASSEETPELPASPPLPAPPPAASIVATGTKTERELDLEKHLALSESARKKAETDASYLADENRRLKDIPRAPRPVARKPDPNTFFDDLL